MNTIKYKVYDFFGENYPDEDWNGRLARTKFNELMKIKEDRINELVCLLEDNDVHLDFSLSSLQKLNDFICSELDKYKPKLNKEDPNCCRYAETPYFRSLAIDCALYLGELLIRISPKSIKWDVYKTNSKLDDSRFYPAIDKWAITNYIYIYIIQYLGGYDNDKTLFAYLYNDLLKEIENE